MTIKKKIYQTNIYSSVITVNNGNIEPEPQPIITVIGRVSDVKANKIARNNLPKNANVVVTGVEYVENIYSMDINTFIENATITNNNEEESE